MLLSAALVFGSMVATNASAATPGFQAAGSAKQVYVTGLAPNSTASLINAAGTTLYTQKADALGGLLFRNVPPGTGYRVRRSADGLESAPLTVHSEAAAPWNPGIYNQSITDNGYTYLTT